MRAADIALFLPEIYRSGAAPGSVLDALLEIMAALHGSLEDAIADPSRLLDPRRAPDRLSALLASWMGLARYLDPPEGAGADRPHPGDLRELAAAGAELGRRRGSAAALARFLETATGIPGFTVEEDTARPFHFRLTIPDAALARRDLVARIVAGEKPAFATCEILPPSLATDF